MNISATYEYGFVEQARRDLKKIENSAVSKAETLEDLRNTTGKSFRTADLEKLMEKYDPEAYEKYSKIAFTAEGGRTQSGLRFLSGWMDDVKAGLAKKDKAAVPNNISGKNEEKLSQRAQDFLKGLRSRFGDYDFMIGNSTDDLKALSKSGSKEFSVIFSSKEIEKMASDEKYAQEKMEGVMGAVKMCKRICEENGYKSDPAGFRKDTMVNKIGVTVDDDGRMKFFAELEKTSAKQKERIENARERHAAEKKAGGRWHKRNPYEKEEKESVKRTSIQDDSLEGLRHKIHIMNWDDVAESKSGDRFNFSV